MCSVEQANPAHMQSGWLAALMHVGVLFLLAGLQALVGLLLGSVCLYHFLKALFVALANLHNANPHRHVADIDSLGKRSTAF